MKLFDRVADIIADWVASAFFFAFCVLVVIVWLPSILLIRDIDTWQLIINTLTTIITFLLVALLHNGQHRFEKATNQRLHDLAERLGDGDPVADEGQRPERDTVDT